MNLLSRLQETFRATLADFTADPAPFAAMVRPAQNSQLGDYQANFAMPLAKQLGRKPPELARDVVAKLPLGDWLEPPEVAGPGFINLRLRPDWLAGQVAALSDDDRLGVSPAVSTRTLVIDFSSPNVAKPMHVGHLRSTIIGDALTRLYRFLGHRVITDNHLGDWGTQFGILLYGYKHFRNEQALADDPVRELARIYIHVRGLMKAKDDEEEGEGPVAEAARHETAKLHAGDPENVRLWKQFMPWCLEEIDRTYRRLGVTFDHTYGESFYNPMLPDVVKDLKAKSIAEPGERGSWVVHLKEGQPPAMVQKSDGAFTYTTTDLATIRYRAENWHPDEVLYVVGAPQALHFQNLFALARRWGYDRVKLEHIAFGSVLGPDRKPFKTREGGTVELGALLDEALERGLQVYEKVRQERRERGEEVPELSDAEREDISREVGLGAVKYADLSQNRTTDYVFQWDKMLAMEGNTATYMQYAFARIRSIFRKGEVNPEALRKSAPPVIVSHPAERALILQLFRFEEALTAAALEYRPNIVTAYLWDLAKNLSGFYQHCNVLKAERPELRQSRLLLCDLTGRVIQKGLDMLGIRTIERM